MFSSFEIYLKVILAEFEERKLGDGVTGRLCDWEDDLMLCQSIPSGEENFNLLDKYLNQITRR